MGIGLDSGLLFLAIGILLIALAWGLTRWALRGQASWQAAINESTVEKNPEHNDAVLLVHTGGGVDYVNMAARQLFGLDENEIPNLERFARRVRPSDIFWQLCASEGQARFSVGGKLVEAVSYQVPGRNSAILLSLRQPEISSGLADSQDVSGSVLRIITDFGQAIAENLNLDATLSAVLENVDKLVASDILEVKVRDQMRNVFVSYRFGMEDGRARLERSMDTRFGNYSTYIAEEEAPLFVSDTESYQELAFLKETDQYSIRSYMGLPLLAGGELVGMLEVGQIAPDVYSDEDQDILKLLAGQAAVAIRNALLYENEQRRAKELSSLASLAQSVGSLQDREDYFAALVKSIQPLFDVDIVGFLLYDEDRRVLKGQVPFVGIPAHIVNIYRTEVAVDSSANEIIKGQKI
ncbi:MAG: GAF domain-containing protein, partial [Anaerolineae bacterium]|nr:GAF domain-containing protein [Anaerolineae bacterium]